MEYHFYIKETEYLLLRDFIHQRFGIYFADEKQSLFQMKLYPRIISQGLSSFNEYYQLLKCSPMDSEELYAMMAHLTNNETYFFREAAQLYALRDQVLPDFRSRREKLDRKLRIVSAGCSSGEEAYSVAMMVYQSGNFFWDWDISIIGMDVSPHVLDIARKAVYGRRSMRATAAEQKDLFFNANENGTYQVKPLIQQMVTFRRGSICDKSSWRDLLSIDIILCRNVLIYFSEKAIAQTLAAFSASLAPDGYLLLGHSESLIGMSKLFTQAEVRGAIMYRKREDV